MKPISIHGGALMKIVKDFRRGMLGRKSSRGKCWMLSLPLASYLELMGHDCKPVQGVVDRETPARAHVWIELADGRIVDVTADQFSTTRRPMPKIFIGERPAWYIAIDHSKLSWKPIRKRISRYGFGYVKKKRKRIARRARL